MPKRYVPPVSSPSKARISGWLRRALEAVDGEAAAQVRQQVHSGTGIVHDDAFEDMHAV